MKWQKELTLDELLSRATVAFCVNVDEVIRIGECRSLQDAEDFKNCMEVIDETRKFLDGQMMQD